MKHNILLYAMLAMAFSLASCSDDDEETCSADDDVCTVVVTVCCTSETDCKYQVGDKEYNTIDEALQDSECSAAGRAPDDAKGSVAERFRALTARAKANI